MNEILIATKIVEKIMNEDTPSNVIMRNYFLSHFCPRETRKTIQALVIKTLTNWYVFSTIVKDSFPGINKTPAIILSVGLANTIFVHAFSDEDTKDKVLEALGDNHSLSITMIETLLFHNYDRLKLVPSYVESQSNEYYHLRYNIPLWLVEMWNRHYGKNVSYRMMAALRTKSTRSFRVNDNIIKRRDLLDKYMGVLEPGISETTVNCMGNYPLSKLECYRRGEVIPITEGANHVINKIPFYPFDKVLVVSEHHSSLALAMMSRLKEKQSMLYAIFDKEDLPGAKKDIEKYHFSDVSVIDSSLKLLLTYVSYPHDVVVVLPPSSRFQYIKNEFDFFFRFQRDQLDDLLARQSDYLEECAQFVKEGGLLVYMIETANNKEGSMQIHDFIQNHQEFSLIEERQMLPLDRRQSLCYFAFLKKEKMPDD